MRKILGFLLIILAVFNISAATYYIDYNSGLDSNSGTSTNFPWKNHPFMPSWKGSYSHNPGDQFIFKGGVTWPSVTMPIQFGVGGTASKYDYYGVNKSWYVGTFWSRPVFDGQGQVGGLFWMHVTANNVMIDNFDLRGVMAASNFGQACVAMEGATNVTVTNCWLHNWNHTSAVTTDGEWGGFFNNSMTAGQGLANVKVTHCDIGNPENGGNMGCCLFIPGEVEFCKIHDSPQGILHGGYSVHDNEFYNINASYDPTQHCNTAYIDVWNAGLDVTGPCLFYNNYIHDVSASEPIYLNGTVPTATGYADFYIYNNVFINNNYKTVHIDPYGGTPMRVYINNNTFDNNLGVQIDVVPRSDVPNTISFYNNLMIGGTETFLGGTINVLQGNNIFYTTEASANSAGYLPANYYAPSASTDPNVGAGINLTSLNWPNLDFDTSRGNYRVPVSRPSAGNWDIGAYQYNGVVITNSPPSAPTNLRIVQ